VLHSRQPPHARYAQGGAAGAKLGPMGGDWQVWCWIGAAPSHQNAQTPVTFSKGNGDDIQCASAFHAWT
jgi:hypothetical protein